MLRCSLSLSNRSILSLQAGIRLFIRKSQQSKRWTLAASCVDRAFTSGVRNANLRLTLFQPRRRRCYSAKAPRGEPFARAVPRSREVSYVTEPVAGEGEVASRVVIARPSRAEFDLADVINTSYHGRCQRLHELPHAILILMGRRISRRNPMEERMTSHDMSTSTSEEPGWRRSRYPHRHSQSELDRHHQRCLQKIQQ